WLASEATVMNGPTPLVVLAGALGAGKTTLLARCLADPALTRTAVVIDELGELSVDAHLLPASSAFVKRAPCGRWTDTLHELAAGDAEPFERVIVEANGVATPSRVVEALAQDDVLSRRFSLEGIVAAVDAARGEGELESDALARAQGAGA